MKVYAHFLEDNDIQYRWRTLLQFGNSWNIIGTIYMKNPGSSNRNSKTELTDNDVLSHLNEIDNSDQWYLFTVDNTMKRIVSMMQEYMDFNNRKLEGIVQIFNLFNVRDKDLGKALNKLSQSVCKKTFTVDDDIKHIVAPIYIGWGSLWKEKKHIENARRIFSATLKHTSYLYPSIEQNRFYHPLWMMGIAKNNPQSIYIRQCFYQNTTTPQNIPFKIRPTLDSNKNAKLFSEKTKLEKYQNERYLLSNDIQVTVAHQGYVAIRHISFNGKNKYTTTQYPHTQEIRSILSKYGFDLNSDVWLGTKAFPEYYENENIVESIISELKNIQTEIQAIK